MDTVGEFIRPLLAIALMAAFDDRFRWVFWCALIPGVDRVNHSRAAVQEPKTPPRGEPRRAPINWQELQNLGPGYWRVLGVDVVLNLARFSEAFLILRATGLGLPLAWAPIVLVVTNIVYVLTAYPVGILSDKASKRFILFAGFFALIAADIVHSFGPGSRP